MGDLLFFTHVTTPNPTTEFVLKANFKTKLWTHVGVWCVCDWSHLLLHVSINGSFRQWTCRNDRDTRISNTVHRYSLRPGCVLSDTSGPSVLHHRSREPRSVRSRVFLSAAHLSFQPASTLLHSPGMSSLSIIHTWFIFCEMMLLVDLCTSPPLSRFLS